MASFGISIPDEVRKRLDGYRERITSEHNLYRDPSRSAVITQAIIEFLDRHDKAEKVETR
jgi:metal-responsive CopG/Arc/MetJ family transcriptional regulator